MLSFVYPDGEVYYDSNHAIFFLNGHFYDITGEVDGRNHLPISSYKGLAKFLKYKASVQLV